MIEKLISIVVPIYNVEKYLDCCIESITKQTYKNIEIILVDDGSTDASPKMCDNWVKIDSRIRVIHKENQGAGMARNTGIAHAKGDYICFFDSDDYVDCHAIKRAYEMAEQYKTDIVLYGYVEVSHSGNIIEKHIPKVQKQLFVGEEIQNALLPDLIDCSCKGRKIKGLLFSLWVCMFSMPLIRQHNVRFESEREVYSEDSYALIGLYQNVNRVCVINEPLYYHRRNNTSLSLAIKKDRFAQIKVFASKALKLADACGYNEKTKVRICSLVFNLTIDAMKQIVLSDASFISKLKYLHEIVCDSYFRMCLKKCCYGKDYIAKKMLQKVILLKTASLTYALIYLKMVKNREKYMRNEKK